MFLWKIIQIGVATRKPSEKSMKAWIDALSEFP